jgi:Zn ribbon nucleic-acid-binding protein
MGYYIRKCPNCGKDVNVKSWSEEGLGEVEYHLTCSCGYFEHYAYGHEESGVIDKKAECDRRNGK